MHVEKRFSAVFVLLENYGLDLSTVDLHWAVYEEVRARRHIHDHEVGSAFSGGNDRVIEALGYLHMPDIRHIVQQAHEALSYE
jgi:hypothetical protein